jgi:hypothetical protein
LALVLVSAGSAAALPITGDPLPPGTPAYVGSPATPNPVTASAPPQHGTGFGHNVNYAPVSLGPDGTAYIGVLGGLVRIADAS